MIVTSSIVYIQLNFLNQSAYLRKNLLIKEKLSVTFQHSLFFFSLAKKRLPAINMNNIPLGEYINNHH